MYRTLSLQTLQRPSSSRHQHDGMHGNTAHLLQGLSRAQTQSNADSAVHPHAHSPRTQYTHTYHAAHPLALASQGAGRQHSLAMDDTPTPQEPCLPKASNHVSPELGTAPVAHTLSTHTTNTEGELHAANNPAAASAHSYTHTAMVHISSSCRGTTKSGLVLQNPCHRWGTPLTCLPSQDPTGMPKAVHTTHAMAAKLENVWLEPGAWLSGQGAAWDHSSRLKRRHSDTHLC